VFSFLITNYQEFIELKQYSNITKEIYSYYAKKLSNNPTQEEINQFLINHPYNSVARAFLKSFVWDFLHRRDLEIVKIRYRKRDWKTEERTLNKDEYNTFVKALPYRESLICKIMKEAGIRISEVLNLTPVRINFKEQKVLGLGTMASNPEALGKGDKEFVGIISKETITDLQVWIGYNKIGPEDKLFKISASRVWDIMTKVGLKVLGKKIGPHWMKRTCGRWLEEQGYSLEERQYYLKHSRPDTTQKCYSIKRGVDVMRKVRSALENEK
jgi:integrase